MTTKTDRDQAVAEVQTAIKALREKKFPHSEGVLRELDRRVIKASYRQHELRC